ncbi:MAG: TlpA disulfide reductase family protein [Planctomycetota bacterium]
MKTKSVILMAILLLSIKGFAIAVGDDAPALPNNGWHNPPEETDIKNLKGAVIIVELWGIDCAPCKRSLPHMNELYKKHYDDGLRVFAFHVQQDYARAVEHFKNNKFEMPLHEGGRESSAYSFQNGIPMCIVIGVDGKVAYLGSPFDADSVIKKELGKVNPASLPNAAARKLIAYESQFDAGLGRDDFAGKMTAIAKSYNDKSYSSALKKASELVDDPKYGKDAAFIVEKVNTVRAKMLSLSETAVKAEDYATAIDMLERIEKGFKGEDIATDAAQKRKELSKDKNVKEILKIQKKLEELEAKFDWRQPAVTVDLLEKFIADKKNEPSKKAIADATAMLASWKAKLE